jgi:hypothetical protein
VDRTQIISYNAEKPGNELLNKLRLLTIKND